MALGEQALGNLEPWLQPWARWLIQVAQSNGGQVTVTSTYRSPAKQAALYAARATNPYPVAPPGKSYHEFRRAFDLNVKPEWLYQALGELWKSVGGQWWPSDRIHFQA